MKLSVLDRIMLLNVLPKEGSFANLKILRIVRENISFNEEENGLLKFKQDGERTVWNDTVVSDGKLVPTVPELEFTIGKVVTNLIVEELRRLNDEQKLTESHFSLYEKFMTE